MSSGGDRGERQKREKLVVWGREKRESFASPAPGDASRHHKSVRFVIHAALEMLTTGS